MKHFRSILIVVFALGGMMMLDSCSKKSEDPIPLKSNAGADQTVAPFTTVTLDGSASTGEANINYEWQYNSSTPSITDISFVPNNKTATFKPPKNGAYTFTLRITQGALFSEDQVIVTVSGVLTLGGTLTQNLQLTDIEPDPAKPDYKITSDLIVPSGVTLSTPSTGSLLIEADETAGIIFDGGNFTQTTAGTQFKLTSVTGWKGILLKSGSLQMAIGVELQKAGKGLFTGQTETAAITALGGLLSLTNVSSTGSTGYDLLITGVLNGSSTISGNNFTAAKPIKAPIDQLGKIGTGNFVASSDYIVLTTPGAGTTVTTGGNGFVFQSNAKYYIDGDFTTGSTININYGATIYMKAGAGILVSGSFASITSSGGPATIDGLNSAGWKGIAIGSGAQMSLYYLTIKNAGSDVFSTGSFSSTQKATVYFGASTNGIVYNCQIIDSKGYGVVMDGPPGYYVRVTGTTFTNPASAAIRSLVNIIYQVIPDATNTFSMPAGVASVEVLSTNPSTYQPVGTRQALGGANYYLVTGNIITGSPWTLSPGVNMKFKSGKSLDLQGGLTAIGTALNPITFDSEAGTVGTWPGMVIENTYKMEYCQIKNGGELFLLKGGFTSATEKANIVFNYGGALGTNTFKNNTISGSAGYGLLVEALKLNPDAANVANGNTFTSNTSGNIIVK